jgi:TrmH family RNA methyltransferase
MSAKTSFTDVDMTQATAIVVGSEAAGTSQELLDLPHTRIKIPMPGQIESLNASVAGSLLMFELVRQRAGK